VYDSVPIAVFDREVEKAVYVSSETCHVW